MKKIITIILIASAIILNAQTSPSIQWQKTYGGTNTDWAMQVLQTSDSGFIIMGMTLSNDLDVSNNHGGSDIWIIKTDKLGNITWKKTYGGSGNEEGNFSLQQTLDGGFIFTTGTSSNDGNVTSNHGGLDYWVVKIDSIGNVQWQKTYGGSNNDIPSVIKQLPDSSYMVAGLTYSSNGDVTNFKGGSTDMWVIKISNTGVLQWQKTYGGSDNEQAMSIELLSNGGAYIAGHTSSSNLNVTSNHGGVDMWLIKINSSGALLWQKTYGGSANDNLYTIKKTLDNSIVIAGITNSVDGDITNNKGGISDGWILKTDTLGNLLWQSTFGGSGYDRLFSLCELNDSSIVLTGTSDSNNGDLPANYGLNDVWVLKLTKLGILKWSKNFGGSNSESSLGICKTFDNSIVVSGYSNSNDYDVSNNNGDIDFWLLKLQADCSTTTSTTNLSICSTQLPYTWNGKTLNASGIIIDTLINARGCDSIATLNLIVKSNSSSITNLTICPNALPYTWNGLTFNVAGSQTAHLTNSVGCDSAATLNLSVNTQPTPAPNSVCVGSTLQLTNATSGGIWSSANNRANVNFNGLVTGISPGVAVINYKKNNITTSYNILVHPKPNVPSIAYGVGNVNPQSGAPAGSFCINKTFGVIGIPSGGVFETGNSAILNINCSGIVNTVGVGASFLKYTFTNAQGCSNSRTITGRVVNCANRSVNINEQSRIYSNFNLYPNPAKNIVNIKIDNLVGKGTLILTNLLGKQIKQQLLSLGNNSIDVSQLARGVYIVNVITEQGSENKKLLIE